SRKNVKNIPNEPTNIPMSTHVGWNIAQLDGRESRCRLVMMITNRSNHIPTFTNMAHSSTPAQCCRTERIHSSCGPMQLQNTISQNAHQYGPSGRLRNTDCSKW